MMYIIVVQLKPSFRSALYRYLYEKKANSAFAIQIKISLLVNFEYFRALFYRKIYKIEIYDLTYPYLCQMTKDREFFFIQKFSMEIGIGNQI